MGKTNMVKAHDAKQLFQPITEFFMFNMARKHLSRLHKVLTALMILNGEFIIGCGINHHFKSRITDIWKYDATKWENKVKHKKSYEDLNYSKITHNNLNLVGISSEYDALIIDIETCKRVAQFTNKKLTSLPRINCVVINDNDNILLFNGGLFCIRSDKFIHSFPEFNQHISGNFLHADSKILINCELWDLRTLKLYNRINKFNNFLVQKTHNDDILMGIRLKDEHKIKSSNDQFWYWKRSSSPYQRKLKLYDAETFSKIGGFNFDLNIQFANISRDFTKIAVGVLNFNFFKYSLITSGTITIKTRIN
ncbi:hypothetical protein MXB_5678 [Myxobolus squamalis]|nr:hypothetical protein MXB_5678 [Myxobolus squamalis]